MTDLSDPVSATVELQRRFAGMCANGLKDFKIWYVGPRGFGTDGPTVDAMAVEVLSMIDAYKRKDFVGISEKLK